MQLGTGGAAEALRPYVAFNAELRMAFQQFVGRLEAQCRELVHALGCLLLNTWLTQLF